MKCEFCQGSGEKTTREPFIIHGPCPECNGTGIADCCNGMQACQVVDNDWPDNPMEADAFGSKK